MKRPSQHQIDDLGEQIFESALKPLWTPQKQEDDYAIDYIVRVFAPMVSPTTSEPFPVTEPTGDYFAVQLKSTSKLHRIASSVTMPMEVEHLAYYADKEVLPVFLVVVDVMRRDAYWIFLQQYLDFLCEPDWRRQKKVTIHIPQGNSLEASAELQGAVRSALSYMAGRKPMSIIHAVLAHERLLGQRDPRFSVEVHASSGGLTRVFHAKEEVSASLEVRFSTPENRRAFLQGLPVAFEPGDVACDLPIFDDDLKKGGQIQVGRAEHATAILHPTVGHGPHGTVVLAGTLTTGIAGARLEVASDSIPLRVSMNMGFAESDGDSITANIDIDRWRGLPVLALPFFDAIHALLTFARSSDAIIQVIVGAEQLPPLPLHVPPDQPIHTFLDGIRCAREVATHLALNPTFPDRLSRGQLEDLHVLRSLLLEGEYTGPASGRRLTLRGPGVPRAAALVQRGEGEVRVRGRFANEFEFFGSVVYVEATERLFKHFVLAKPERAVRDPRRALSAKRGISKKDFSPTMVLVGTEIAEMHLRSTRQVIRVQPREDGAVRTSKGGVRR